MISKDVAKIIDTQAINNSNQQNGTQLSLIFYNNQETDLFVGLDFSWASFSSPILSFSPSFRSGIPERKHFIRIFPVTSHRRTLPAGMAHIYPSINATGKTIEQFKGWVRKVPFEDIRRFTLSTMSRKT
jgi:hypothetical protein